MPFVALFEVSDKAGHRYAVTRILDDTTTRRIAAALES